jgi:hypothetical protein
MRNLLIACAVMIAAPMLYAAATSAPTVKAPAAPIEKQEEFIQIFGRISVFIDKCEDEFTSIPYSWHLQVWADVGKDQKLAKQDVQRGQAFATAEMNRQGRASWCASMKPRAAAAAKAVRDTL